MSERAEQLRREILERVAEYYAEAHQAGKFVPGESRVPVSGRVYDASDMQSLVDSGLDFWLTTGRFAAEFEREFAKWFGLRFAMLVNSGSSANLLALSCLTSPKLGDRRIRPGDEVITVAAGFPTTVNPILQNGLTPVFIDVDPRTLQVRTGQLEQALSERTKAVILAHTLGSPYDVDEVTTFTRRHNLWFIEDCCDALGAVYKGRKAGTFGDLTTVSFYPAHHITMGEGGCVLTDQPQLRTLVESFRDWGRDCWCETGKANTCGRRFEWQLGDLPFGYDHKYTYSHIGYNLKLTDMQAAIGLSQLSKLPQYIEIRRRNFRHLYEGLKPLESVLMLPETVPGAEPSWFGFPMAVRPEAPFDRERLISRLESRRISSRLLFGGNLVRQPAYRDVPHRVVGNLEGSDFVMRNVLWIGVYPGLTTEMLDFVIETLREFAAEFGR